MTRKTWRCFHCDDVFRSVVDARNHFGTTEASEPACKVQAAGEFGILGALRNLEDQLSRYRADDSDIIRAMCGMQSDHVQALLREEEKGYARGLADAREYPETIGLQRAAAPNLDKQEK
jgi:hypothetical protein